MKKIISIPFFIFLLAVTGCGTIYSTAMDERNMSTIASDTTIKGTIVKKFYDDDKIKSLDISTGCYHGHVYLVGEYDTADQKNRAIKIAKSVEGVKIAFEIAKMAKFGLFRQSRYVSVILTVGSEPVIPLFNKGKSFSPGFPFFAFM